MSYVPPTGEIELKFGDAYTPPTGEIELNFYVSVGVSIRGVSSQEHNPVGNLSRLVTPIRMRQLSLVSDIAAKFNGHMPNVTTHI